VGGVVIAGVTQSAGGTAGGPFGYFNSAVLLAVLAFCGSQALISPIIAAFVYEVLKIYGPSNSTWFTNYEGAIFGLLALVVAVVPGMKLSASSRRAAEREGRSPVLARGRIALATPRVGPLRVKVGGTRAQESRP
jgi:hypothetical protein